MASNDSSMSSSKGHYKEVKSDESREESGLLFNVTSQPLDELELAFWVQVHRRTVSLALMTWGTMPVTFGLAWFGYQISVYAFIMVKFFLMSTFQWLMVRQIKEYVTAKRPNSDEMVALNKVTAWSWAPTGFKLGEICVFMFTAAYKMVLATFELIEAMDPDVDAMTPGSARGAFSKEDVAQYHESWAELPVVGRIVASLGLPGLLTVCLLMIICWQLYVFNHQRSTNRSQMLDPEASAYLGLNCYIGLFQLADVGNLSLLASYFRALWMVHDVQSAAFGGVRLSRYPAVVPEFLCSAWFTISALVLTVEDGFMVVAPLALSIFTTCVTSIRTFYEMASILRPWSRWQGKKYVMEMRDGFLRRVVAWMVIHFVGFTAICMRLVGIWTCPSHEFRISTMRCWVSAQTVNHVS